MEFLLSLPVWVQACAAAVSITALWGGSESVIAGAQDLSRRWGVSELVIGLTAISIGSSLPEMFVGLGAGLRGEGDIVLGNVIGSCLVQGSFILGLVVLIGGPMGLPRNEVKRDGTMMLFAVFLLMSFAVSGGIAPWEVTVSVLLYVSYLYYLIAFGKKEFAPPHMSAPVAFFLVFGGLAIVYFGAEALMTMGMYWGKEAGLSTAFIGILSGIGTTIPELTISLIALLKKKAGISIGNLIGSNITDPLFSLSIGVFAAGGIAVADSLRFVALPVWALISVITAAVLYVNGRITRPWGLLFMVYYLVAVLFVL